MKRFSSFIKMQQSVTISQEGLEVLNLKQLRENIVKSREKF